MNNLQICCGLPQKKYILMGADAIDAINTVNAVGSAGIPVFFSCLHSLCHPWRRVL